MKDVNILFCLFYRPIILGDRAAGSCIAVPFGTTLKERIVGQLGCASASYKAFTVVGPQGTGSTTAVQISGISPAVYYTYLTWTPSTSQYGPNVVCAALTDSSCLNSANHCFTVLGGVPIPTLVNNTCTPSGGINSTTLMGNLGILTWSVDFNSVVIQPQYSAYINYFYSNGSLMFKIDVSSFPSVSFNNLTTYSTLTWQTGNNFPDGGYYITFDYGVGLGPLFCLPQSDAVTDPGFCSFFVRTNDTTTTTTTTQTQTQPTTISGQTLPLTNAGQTLSSTGAPILPVGVTTTTTLTSATVITGSSANGTGSTTANGLPGTTTIFGSGSGSGSNSSTAVSGIQTTAQISVSNTTTSSNLCQTSKCNSQSLGILLASTLMSGVAGHLSSISGVFLYLMKKKKQEEMMGM